MVSTVLQIENIMVLREDFPGEHFICHIDGLALYRVVRPDCVIDEIPSLVQIVILHKLLDEIHVLFDLEIAVGPVIPGRAAHGQEVTDIIIVIAELQPGRNGAKGEAPERPVISGTHEVFLRCGLSVGVELAFHGRHQVLFEIAVKLTELRDGGREVCIAVRIVEGG